MNTGDTGADEPTERRVSANDADDSTAPQGPVGGVEPGPVKPAAPASRLGKRAKLWIAIGVVAVLAALGTGTALVLRDGEGDDSAIPRRSPSTSQSVSPSTSPSSSGTPSPTTAPEFPYQPLWPFASLTEVERWQRDYRSGGHAPWHLDADATAINFTSDYLGFTEVRTVVWRSITGREALVAVGYPVENQGPSTAAVLHLAKYGSGQDAPWEVVGSKDTTFTLSEPGYGTKVGSPVRVGGRVSGVDESIRVQVRLSKSEGSIGETCCLPAGGDNQPWSVTVAYKGGSGKTLIIVASTGGHVQLVERFAITGVRGR